MEYQVEACRQDEQANPLVHSMLRCDSDDRKVSKASDSALPRKASSEDEGDRTVNRHR
jgi:hypothetical protein